MVEKLSQIDCLLEDIRDANITSDDLCREDVKYELQKAINSLRNVLRILEDNL